MDDITQLLQPAGRPELGFHSGTVVSWDSNTGSNVIEVAGAQLVDVPVLNTGETIALKAGHVVGLLRFASSYFILGRVAIPGTDQFAGSAVSFASSGVAENPVLLSTSTTAARASVTLAGPEWADEVVLWNTAIITGHNTRAVGDFLWCVPAAINTPGTAVYTSVDAGGYGSVTGTQTAHLIGDYPGYYADNPITFECRAWAQGGTWGTDSGNTAQIHALAIFKSST